MRYGTSSGCSCRLPGSYLRNPLLPARTSMEAALSCRSFRPGIVPEAFLCDFIHENCLVKHLHGFRIGNRDNGITESDAVPFCWNSQQFVYDCGFHICRISTYIGYG